jgi:hypothetical protein
MSIKHNTIIIKDYLHVFEEYEAYGTILPGQLVELTSAGKVQKHSGAGKTALVMVAIEDALQGKAIDEAYASGDKVRVWIPQRGDMAYLLLADEDSVSIGDFVESNGAGFVRKEVRTNESWESDDAYPGGGAHTLYDQHVVGQAVEAKDLTSLSTTDSSEFGATTTQHTLIRIM